MENLENLQIGDLVMCKAEIDPDDGKTNNNMKLDETCDWLDNRKRFKRLLRSLER
jgi:hypothetical protein